MRTMFLNVDSSATARRVILALASCLCAIAGAAAPAEPRPGHAAQDRAGKKAAAAPEPAGLQEPTRVYKRAGERELSLSLCLPEECKPGDGRPAILFFHGGGWVGGTKEQFRPQARYFARRGAVSFLVEYRLLKGRPADPPTVCIQDAKSAVRWVRAHAAELGVDPERIAAAGGSAGGHLAAFLGLLDGIDDPQDDLGVSAKPQAMLLFNPVFDNGPDGWGHARVGGRWREFSPFHNVSGKAPPAIVFLGDKDALVPVKTAEAFGSAMRAAGVRCEIKIYPGRRHGFFNRDPDLTETLRAADEFLVSLGWLSRPRDGGSARRRRLTLPARSHPPRGTRRASPATAGRS